MQGTEHKHGGRRPRGARWFATLALLFVTSSPVAASLLRMASLALQDTSAIFSYPLQTISDFSEGRMAMFSGSAGEMSQIEDADPNFEWRSTFIPRFEEYAVLTDGADAAILAKDGAKQEAAWKFIAWFTSTDQTIEWSQKTGYLPVKGAAVDDPEMVEYFEENPNHKVPIEQLEYALGARAPRLSRGPRKRTDGDGQHPLQ